MSTEAAIAALRSAIKIVVEIQAELNRQNKAITRATDALASEVGALQAQLKALEEGHDFTPEVLPMSPLEKYFR